MTDPNVAIIILNWNGWKDTIECLESLDQIIYQNYNIIIVDNGSKDDSIQKIEDFSKSKTNFEFSEFSREEIEESNKINCLNVSQKKKMIVLKNEINSGFTGGSNLGIRFAMKFLNPNYFLILNNDTVVDKRFLTYLIEVGESDEKIAVVGPKIYYYYEPEIIQSMGLFINPWKYQIRCPINYESDATIKADLINGAVILIKKSTIDTVGFFDTDYFVYVEETDYCIRVKKHGLYTVCAPKSKVWHKIYSSSGGEVNPNLLYYWTRNIILFYKKNYDHYLIRIFILCFIRYGIQIGVFISKGEYRLLKGVINGLIDGMKGKTGVLMKKF